MYFVTIKEKTQTTTTKSCGFFIKFVYNYSRQRKIFHKCLNPYSEFKIPSLINTILRYRIENLNDIKINIETDKDQKSLKIKKITY
jgi:hypothetical protein